MLAWMQSVMAFLFLHPGALWAGGVVVLVVRQWVKIDLLPISVSQAGNKMAWTCVTSQWPANHNTQWLLSQNVCQQSRQVWDLFFLLVQLKWNINAEFESPDPLSPQTFWETQSRSHDAGSRKSISQSALALPPSVLHSRYWLEELSTHQTQR